MMKKVAYFIRSYPIASEAFITEQAKKLRLFKAVIYARNGSSNEGNLDCQFISKANNFFDKSKLRVFSFFPGVWAWGGKHEFDGVSIIHAHFGPNGVYALPLVARLKLPLIVTFHGFDVTVSKSKLLFRSGIFGFFYVLFFPLLKRRANYVIAVSKFVEKKLLEHGFKADQIRQHYIGVDLNKFHPLPFNQRSNDIVCVARLMDAKGIPDLITAFSKVSHIKPSMKLRLIGGGEKKDEYIQLTQKLGVAEKVVFEGTMPHPKVAEIVRQCSINILASKKGKDGWQEAFGLASIEAGAAGLPSIVTNHGGLVETVQDGKTGYIVTEGDVDTLAKAIESLLIDDEKRRVFGDAARKFVCENFDLIKQTKLLENIYMDALKNE